LAEVVPGYAEASTCGCGNVQEHVFFRDVRIWWCGHCGAWRHPFDGKWRVPIEQSRAVAQEARFVMVDRNDQPPSPAEQDDIPTQPNLGSRKPTLSGIAPVKAEGGDEEKDAS
jgi:hypothetical protein